MLPLPRIYIIIFSFLSCYLFPITACCSVMYATCYYLLPYIAYYLLPNTVYHLVLAASRFPDPNPHCALIALQL